MAHGFDNTVVLAKETTIGTAPTSGFKWIGMVESFEPEENNNVDQRLAVGSRAPLMMRVGAREVDGSLSYALQNARLLAMALGKETITGDATNGYVHTIVPTKAGEVLPSITVHNNNPAIPMVRNYVGGKVDSFTITAAAEEAVMMEADLLFLDVQDTGTGQVVAAELDNYFMFYEGTVKINTTTVANVTEFELEVNNNLERRFTLNGSRGATRIEEGNLEIASSLTMTFNDKTQWDLFKAGGTVSVELSLIDVANPTKHKIVITLSGGLYDTNAISVNAEDVQEQELEAVFTGITVVATDLNATLI